MSEYAHPELLTETDWLAQHLDAPSTRIVDCDEWLAYQRAHIPGAIGIPVHHYLKDAADPNHVMPADQFERLIGELGIGNDTLVIAYDGSGGLYAARLWWALDRYGHARVKVLNGGINKWLAEGRQLTKRIPEVTAATFTARPNDELLCTLDYLLANRERGDALVWDVRSHGEYTGETPRQNKRAGHIPSAVNLEWLNLVTDDDLRVWKSADELLRLLQQHGITPEKEVLVHCQAGIRAAHGTFTLRLLGYDRVRNYDASWNEYGNRDDTPITPGE